MSLGGGASSALDTAVGRSIAAGVTYAVAAGNEQRRTRATSRRRARRAAITVGATTLERRARVVLELRHVPGHLRAGLEHHLGLAHVRHRDEHDQRHVDGVAARRGRGRAVPRRPTRPPRPAQVAAALIGARRPPAWSRTPGSGSPNRLLFTGPASTPDPAAPSCAAQAFTGTFDRLAPVRRTPAGASFTAAAGAHKGCLTGPANADFDLYLERWNGSAWAWVARGIGQTSTETVTYSGSAGTYRWRVYSYSGAGAYTLEVTRP